MIDGNLRMTKISCIPYVSGYKRCAINTSILYAGERDRMEGLGPTRISNRVRVFITPSGILRRLPYAFHIVPRAKRNFGIAYLGR